MDLGDPVLEGGSLDLILILYLPIPENAFQSDELPLLESLGELGEIRPGIDAMPFGAGFVFAFVVLPAFLGCDDSIPQSGSVESTFVNSFTSCMFDDIHRGVGGAQQAGHTLAILRIHRNPNTS
jgi:hypothetical protein